MEKSQSHNLGKKKYYIAVPHHWIRKVIRFWGPTLTVVGLGLTMYQFLQANDQTNLLSDIADRMSTKSIGVFPNNVPQINGLLKRSETSLKILIDVPAYAQYSSPTGYNDYRSFFAGLGNKDIKIQMVVYKPEKRSAKTIEQFNRDFPNDKSFILWKEKNIDKITDYLNQDRDLVAPDSLTRNWFFRIIEKRNNTFAQTLRNTKQIEYKEVEGKDFPMFFWIRDEKEAIISFIDYPKNTKEVGFTTTDKEIIKILMEIFDGAYNQQ